MRRKLTGKRLFYGFICLDVVLLLAAMLLFGYIFHSTRQKSPPQPAETVSQAPWPSVSIPSSPVPSAASTASPSPTAAPLETADFSLFRLSYDPQRMTVTDRSEETGVVSVVLSGQELPRVDIQTLEGLPREIGQAQFELLSKAAVQAYFVSPPEEISLENVSLESSEYTAALTLPATADSPALSAHIRLIPGDDHSVLSVCLLPEGTDTDLEEAFLHVQASIQ